MAKKVFLKNFGWPMDVAKTDYGEDSTSTGKVRIGVKIYHGAE